MKTIHPAIAEHVMEENERMREVLRCIADLPMDRCSTENDYRLSAAKAIALGALSKQAEPSELGQGSISRSWRQAVIEAQAEPTDADMATSAAQGFRDGQAAVEPAPAQGELMPCPFCGGKVREPVQHGEGHRIVCHCGVEYSGLVAAPSDLIRCWNRRSTRPSQTEQRPVAVPEDFQPLETIRWWISAYTNPENGPSYQGHGMMVQMLCEYEALRIMLSGRAQQWPTAYPHEAMDKLATDRYRVGAAGAGTLHRYAVRAGDGEQELYRGSESDCQNVARKLAGAFLDGGLAFQAMIAAPIAFQSEQTPVGIVDRLSVAAGKTAAHFDIADCPIGTRLYAAPIAQSAPQPEQSGLVEEAYCEGWNAGQEAIEQRYQHTPRSLSEGWELFKVENIDALSAVTAERDRLLSDNASLRGSCKALGEENKQLKRENKRQGRTIAAMAAKEE